MTNPSDHILWVDIETTGLDFNHDDILEVGLVLTDTSLNEVATYQTIVRPRSFVLAEQRMRNYDGIVWDMHQKSGLWDLVKENQSRMIFVVDAEIEAWLKERCPKLPVPLAGSGVAAFDRHMIRSHMHRLNKLLTYWSYDVGALRRFVTDIVDLDLPTFDQEEKEHRALSDVCFHLDEARAFRSAFWSMASNG